MLCERGKLKDLLCFCSGVVKVPAELFSMLLSFPSVLGFSSLKIRCPLDLFWSFCGIVTQAVLSEGLEFRGLE